MLESMLPKAGVLNPSVVLPNPDESESAEMLSVLHYQYSTRLRMDNVLGLTPEQLYCLMDDKFRHESEPDVVSSDPDSENKTPQDPEAQMGGGGVMDSASDHARKYKDAGGSRGERRYWIPPNRVKLWRGTLSP